MEARKEGGQERVAVGESGCSGPLSGSLLGTWLRGTSARKMRAMMMAAGMRMQKETARRRPCQKK